MALSYERGTPVLEGHRGFPTDKIAESPLDLAIFFRVWLGVPNPCPEIDFAGAHSAADQLRVQQLGGLSVC